MNCKHTGLPMRFCGHCNGTNPTIADPPSVYAVKPHEKLGQSTGVYGSHQAREAVVEGSLYTHRPRSAWARENMLRSAMDLGLPVQAVGIIVPDLDKVIAAMCDTTPHTLGTVEKLVGYRSKRLQLENGPRVQSMASPSKQNVARAKNPNLRIQQFYTRSRT